MFIRVLALLLLIAPTAVGCSSMFISSTPPPKYYQLDYQPVPVQCSNPSPKSIQIGDFSASSPFDRPEMVVIKEGNQVLFSSRYQWVATPGAMLADNLLRDVNLGSSFQAASASSPTNASLVLTARINNFAWVESEAGSVAELQVDVRLSDVQGGKGVLFRKSYTFKSRPFSENSSETFSRAMSQVVSEFSEALRRDLCSVT